MTRYRISAFKTLAKIAKVHCQDDEDAEQPARIISERISLIPAMIIGDDIMLSLVELVGYSAQEMRRSELAEPS